MADAARARRLSGRIQQIVATTIERQIKDPRLGMVTVTDVRVTGDLHDATIFYTVLGDDADREGSAAALESAKGVLRSEVGRQTGVRFTPTLTFRLDALPDSAKAMDDLLARAASEDARLRASREGAQPAGDADPYRKPREADPDDDPLGAIAVTPGFDGDRFDGDRFDEDRSDGAGSDGARSAG